MILKPSYFLPDRKHPPPRRSTSFVVGSPSLARGGGVKIDTEPPVPPHGSGCRCLGLLLWQSEPRRWQTWCDSRVERPFPFKRPHAVPLKAGVGPPNKASSGEDRYCYYAGRAAIPRVLGDVSGFSSPEPSQDANSDREWCSHARGGARRAAARPANDSSNSGDGVGWGYGGTACCLRRRAGGRRWRRWRQSWRHRRRDCSGAAGERRRRPEPCDVVRFGVGRWGHVAGRGRSRLQESGKAGRPVRESAGGGRRYRDRTARTWWHVPRVPCRQLPSPFANRRRRSPASVRTAAIHTAAGLRHRRRGERSGSTCAAGRRGNRTCR